jgi:hypothetical protein
MLRTSLFLIVLFTFAASGFSQQIIPLDTVHWEIQANAFLLEPYKGQEAIYLQGGTIRLKEQVFRNGTIEYDIFLKETQGFPGVTFRVRDNREAEEFYLRPHLSGKPDATQAIPITGGLAAWQLYFGPKYSFPHRFRYDEWTHVKLVVEEDRAQVYLDHADKPQLSWYLTQPPMEGEVRFSGGNNEAMHLANIIVNPDAHEIKDFEPIEREALPGLVSEWEVSDKFEESRLDDLPALPNLISSRKWSQKVSLEEGTAANISRKVVRYDDTPGNTVFARITISSDTDATRLFEFGYSDRVVALLNEKPIYKGNNNYRSRDYRYLGTIGLFDAIYLDLKKGDNTLLMAVSEDFGGWLITGRFVDPKGIKINY